MFCPSGTSTIRTIWVHPTNQTAVTDNEKDDTTCGLRKIDACTMDDNCSNSKNVNEKKEKDMN